MQNITVYRSESLFNNRITFRDKTFCRNARITGRKDRESSFICIFTSIKGLCFNVTMKNMSFDSFMEQKNVYVHLIDALFSSHLS